MAKTTLQKAFWALFFVLFLFAFIASFHRTPWYLLPAVVVLLVGLGVVWLSNRASLPTRALFIAFLVLLAATAGVQVYMALNGLSFMRHTGDWEAVYTAVNELMEHGHFTDSVPYVLRYPHQTFIIAELYLFRWVVTATGLSAFIAPHQAYGLLAAVGIDVAILFFIGALRLWFGTRRTLSIGILALLVLSPLRYAVFEGYTHQLCYPYLFAAVFFLSLAVKRTGRLSKILLFCLSGALFGAAALMAGSTTILLVAAVLFVIFAFHWRQALVYGLVLVVCFSLTQFGFRQLWQHSKYIDMSAAEVYEYPLSYYIATGLLEDGQFNPAFSAQTYEAPNKQARHALAMETIRARLAEMGPIGLFTHQWQKLHIPWSQFIHSSPSPTASNVGVLPALLLLLLAGAVSQFLKPQVDGVFFSGLAMVGVLLFLQIWETFFTYSIPFLLFMIPVADEGARFLLQPLPPLFSRFAKKAPPQNGAP